MDRSKLLIYLFLFLCVNISLSGATKVTYVEKVHRRVLFLNSSLYKFEKKKNAPGVNITAKIFEVKLR